MVKGITRDLIRKYLDDLGVSTRVDDDGDLFTILRADNDFDHDVIIYYSVNNNWLRVFGYAMDYEVPDSNKGRVLLALNEHNQTHATPTGVLETKNNAIKFKHSLLLDEEVSETYIKENGIKMGNSGIWHAFVDFNKR